MPLQSSGAISLDDIQTEFGGSNPIDIDEYYNGGTNVPDTTANNSIPSSGTISFDDFYGGDDTVSGGDTGSDGCLVYGTLINMFDGSSKAIEDIIVGDKVISHNINGLGTIEEWEEWSTNSLTGSSSISTVKTNKLNSYHYYFLINGTLKATWEQPFLTKKSNQILFKRVRDIEAGEFIYSTESNWVEVLSKERVDENVQVGVLDVEEVDNYYAGGFLTHNTKEIKNFT